MKSKKKRTSFITAKNWKKYRNVFLVLSVILFFFVIILSSATYVVFDNKAYFREQENSGVYGSINKSEAQDITSELIDYFRYKDKLDTDFFNENEQQHLQDVKDLIGKINIVYYISIMLFVLFFFIYYQITKDFSRSVTSILIFGSMFSIIIFIIIYFTDFSFLFDKFHILFFEGNYTFPPNSNIIKLFPAEFFSGMFFTILKITMIKTTILFSAGILINSLDYFSRIRNN
jgi:integral membrane protein (TIGR01906 family)